MYRFRGGRKSVSIRRCLAAGLAVVALAFLPAPAPALAAEPTCREMYFPVTLLGTPQTMHGNLCVPAGGSETVQVLIPGGTYNSTYWDIGFEPEKRSYRLAMNRAGYATLALDRLGTGRSSVPPSVLLTTITEAGSVHEVVQMLKSGEKGPRFEKVILGGHSFGSGVAIVEAATFHDVDGVLVTGLAHRLNVGGAVPIFAATLPAFLDPKFAGDGHDLAYLTTLPNTRYSIFHKPGPMVEGAIAFDEATKDTSVHTQAVDLFPLGVILPYSKLIDAPVMIALGQDSVFCGLLATDCSSAEGIKRTEAAYYSPAADLNTYALQGYGHAINYAPNAPDYHRAVVEWADRKVGTQ
ncbi:alpha/beta hydrolase [Amycolatopsis nigrescens]|uniref:alpha/beta hydrolase n=1 Tax=Amycolatopsis nigrescens TaxID=381445 RepID=UPI00035CBD99|nr:alpha/beta hydrolase [Amycolatopsis nigrescens]